ncbi:ROK family protein [Anaerovirgula multivorans]|uniref:ROK family protein n=1 Tax=Anaerovirgula multivorans TaxID=312168 RepID=A0A239JXQ5_9FIRM|nr:ROK family protein [Anaerovirgula multivorans]SNT10272.1 ROK family protein [Anaerovirgula multivorans]
MASIAHVVDPHTFVLGGGVALSAPKFIDKIKDKFDTYIYEVMRGKIRIEPASLADPGIVSAMLMAKN